MGPAVTTRLRKDSAPVVRPALPAAFRWLWTGRLINQLAGFVVPFLAVYLADHGMSDRLVGGISVGFGAGSFAGSTLGGFLSDLLGRRRVIVSGQLLVAFCTLLLVVEHAPLLIAAGVCGIGFFSAVPRPAQDALVADLVAPQHRRRAFSLLYWATNIGAAVAPLAATGTTDLAALFVLDATTTLVYAAVVLRAVPETRPPRTKRAAHLRTGRRRTGTSSRSRTPDRTLLLVLAAFFLLMVALDQYAVTLPLAMRGAGLSSRSYGLVLSLNAALVVLGQPVLTRLVDGRPLAGVAAAGSLLVGSGFGLMVVTQALYGALASTVVWTAGEMLVGFTVPTLVAQLAPPQRRGTYQGLYQSTFALATVAAPSAGTLVLTSFGPTPLWLGTAAVAALSTGCFCAIPMFGIRPDAPV